MSIPIPGYRIPAANRKRTARSGTTAVEMAMIMPVFFAVLFALVEFGHAMMVRSLVMSTTKDAARYGAVGEISTKAVREYIEMRLSKVMDPDDVEILIKDANFMDAPNPVFPGDLSTLPDIELSDAESRRPFVIRITVPYEATALLPPTWTTGMTISADSVVRHE